MFNLINGNVSDYESGNIDKITIFVEKRIL